MVELPGVSQTPASSASSVAQPVSARRRHRPASTTDTTLTDGTVASGSQPAKKNTRGPCWQLKTAKLHSSLAHDVGHVVRTHCPMRWKSWKVMPDEIKMGANYNLEDLNEESLAYVNRLFGERYKQWKSDLHHHFQAYDDPEVALREGCPKELEGREDKIDVFGDVYVRPGNELAHPFIRRWWRGAGWCFRVRLPTSSRDSDRVCRSSTGCWLSHLDGDVGSDSRKEAGNIL
ncbi:unnamed protein product [Prunus brigantina]